MQIKCIMLSSDLIYIFRLKQNLFGSILQSSLFYIEEDLFN